MEVTRIKSKQFAIVVGDEVLWVDAQNEAQARMKFELTGVRIPPRCRFWTSDDADLANAPADVREVLA